ncbi:MAG: class I SAM-dependent methyltransferase [Actinobacteria bacterium]|nr:MAG: class I SAM-dependent methyltransferase [Actinomycetota bacterium]
MAGHDETIRREFAKQAGSFEDPDYAFADRRLMRWILTHVPCQAGSLVLDVAGGTGHLARAYAAEAGLAVVADLTPEMLAAGKRQSEAEGRRNVMFVCADAAGLPFLAETFDLVVSRFAAHHFEQPALVFAEMARVCRAGGRVGIVDLVAADASLASEHDRFERLRDPSHTQALPADELARLLKEVGLEVIGRTERDQPVPIERWLSQAQAPPEVGETVREALAAELDGGAPTGMRPHIRDGELYQTQRWAILVAAKTGAGDRPDGRC